MIFNRFGLLAVAHSAEKKNSNTQDKKLAFAHSMRRKQFKRAAPHALGNKVHTHTKSALNDREPKKNTNENFVVVF